MRLLAQPGVRRLWLCSPAVPARPPSRGPHPRSARWRRTKKAWLRQRGDRAIHERRPRPARALYGADETRQSRERPGDRADSSISARVPRSPPELQPARYPHRSRGVPRTRATAGPHPVQGCDSQLSRRLLNAAVRLRPAVRPRDPRQASSSAAPDEQRATPRSRPWTTARLHPMTRARPHGRPHRLWTAMRLRPISALRPHDPRQASGSAAPEPPATSRSSPGP